MSEGQPALTPDQENELRLYAMRPEGHGLRVSRAAVAGALAELAREREARQEAERVLADAKRFHGNEFKDRQVAEGRVRELREALETIDVEVTEVGEFTPEAARALREALVGLPE